MSRRSTTDITVDRWRERKFRADLKRRILAGSDGIKCTIIVHGLLIEYPNGEKCRAIIENATGR